MTLVSYAPCFGSNGYLRTRPERELAPKLAHSSRSRPPHSAGPVRTPIKLGMRLMARLEHGYEFLMRREGNYRHTPTKERRIGIDRRMLQRFAERRRRLVPLTGVAY